MKPETLYLALVLGAAVVSFYRGPRIDLTALLVLLSLLVPWKRSGEGALEPILTLEEGLTGFGSPAVAMVASMFVLSAALERTQAAKLVGSVFLTRGAGSELWLQMTILTVATLFSALISDTTTVLVWMPLVLAVCRERGYAPSRMLLPLAFASLLGGQWTLIGTRSNVIASDYLRSQTGEGLGFLSFLPVAACIWLVALAFFVLIGRRLLPAYADERPLAARYEVTEYLSEILAVPGSSLLGRRLDEIAHGLEAQVTVLGLVRLDAHLPVSPTLVVEPDDVLIVQGRMSHLSELLQSGDVKFREELRLGEKTLKSLDLRMVEALVTPRSPLEGLTVRELDYHERFGLSVLALGRHGHSLTDRPLDRELAAGDALLVVGHEEGLERLRAEPGLALMEPRDVPVTKGSRTALTLALLVGVVLLSALRVVPAAVAMLGAAAAAILFRCIGLREAYRAIDPRTIVVLGGMIPFGLALEKTGTAHLFAEGTVGALGAFGPHVLFAVLLLITVAFTQVIENAAAAAILAPIAFGLARSSGADPAPFLLGMAICTSAGFSTPWAHESTLLVLAPGRYAPKHYLSLGIPFTLITWAVTVVVLPWIYPLR